MLSFFKRLFGPGSEPDNTATATVLRLESSLQAVSMDLAEKVKEIELLKLELQRKDSKSSVTVNSLVSSELESLFSELAPTVSQIVTMDYLLNVESKPLQAKDSIKVAMRLVHSLQEKGLELKGEIGQQVGFDSNLHEMVSLGDSATQEGDSVTVRMPAVLFKGSLLKKIAVVGKPPTGI